MSGISNGIRGVLAWGGALCGLLLIALLSRQTPLQAVAAETEAAQEDLIIFQEKLAPGWQDWSWTNRMLGFTGVRLGKLPSIMMVPEGWKGLFLHHPTFSTRGYRALTFWIHGGTTGGQRLNVCAVGPNNQFGKPVPVSDFLIGRTIPAGKFTLCTIPLERLNAANAQISGFCFQDGSGRSQEAVYLADIRLSAPPQQRSAGGPIRVIVHPGQRIGPISPYIYGMATPTAEHFRELRLKLWRWGGNPNTRYNWEKGNCWNAARDWYFRNGNYGNTSPQDRQPSGVADKAIAAGRAAGADAYITVPTMGWVARDDNNATASVGVPDQSGPPVAPGSEAIAGYDPTENRRRVSVRSLPRKGRPFADPPDLTDDVVYQDEWIYHLTRKFGRASEGGVRFYAMDNEPDLWDVTHTDMHPVRPGYDEILRQFLDYANAVKDVDPSAQIGGPVSWGWTGYFFSPLDRGNDNYRTHADRKAHGDVPFLPWFLQQVAAHDRKKGRRTLDILDVHYYPQASGVYSGSTDPQTNALRLRSVRSLWDPNYTDESWIGTAVQLIPRLKQWVSRYYPGTKIGIMEWNWGAGHTLNGGLAVAEVLGVFGREQLDMACYWAIPGAGTPAFFAFKMYRNADDRGNGFGDVAVQASSSAPDRISCYGSIDAKTGAARILLINKMPATAAPITLEIQGTGGTRTLEVYRYSGADLKKIVRLPDLIVPGGKTQMELPPYSLTLLRQK
ncbi:MAG: glycoside hydrolase family 44 protein [Chloroherpetonaceae bacterium]|nr:hypothetical protein [Chthonomonadaceae bacterium]MDW8207467.1 glycoside hydrolase family 44 protein [Chloroherpetonaceae bacterium]